MIEAYSIIFTLCNCSSCYLSIRITEKVFQNRLFGRQVDVSEVITREGLKMETCQHLKNIGKFISFKKCMKFFSEWVNNFPICSEQKRDFWYIYLIPPNQSLKSRIMPCIACPEVSDFDYLYVVSISIQPYHIIQENKSYQHFFHLAKRILH